MTAPSHADLSSLASLAQTGGRDLRRVLLRAQTDLFVAGPRDQAAAATYAALALGLLTHVDHATLRALQGALAGVPETPAVLRDALSGALAAAAPAGTVQAGMASIAPAGVPDGADPDLRRAHDPAVLDGHALAALVEAARARADLGAALLARPEPGLYDRAALYRHADIATRRGIRTSLAERLQAGAAPRLTLSPEIRRSVLSPPDGPALARMLARLGIGPSPAAAARGLAHDEIEQEMFALALVALGLTPDESIAVFLTLDPSISHAFPVVMRLAGIVRTTTPAVAAFLVTGDARVAAPAPPTRTETHARAARPAARAHEGSAEARMRAAPARRQSGG